jgi:hypothetical protein
MQLICIPSVNRTWAGGRATSRVLSFLEVVSHKEARGEVPVDSIGGRSGAVKYSVEGVSGDFFEWVLIGVLGRRSVSGGFEGFGV